MEPKILQGRDRRRAERRRQYTSRGKRNDSRETRGHGYPQSRDNDLLGRVRRTNTATLKGWEECKLGSVASGVKSLLSFGRGRAPEEAVEAAGGPLFLHHLFSVRVIDESPLSFLVGCLVRERQAAFCRFGRLSGRSRRYRHCVRQRAAAESATQSASPSGRRVLRTLGGEL